ncbi:hypothetical protein [Aurantibacter sp.]|uniref:hypothetical protein n=1 Tax=Aurantibacter sp. TaxID=2807103 RepID=UPI0035C7C6D8
MNTMYTNKFSKYFSAFVLCFLIQFSYSQTDGSQFNLPPGAKFSIKQYEKIDYSYKLTQNLNLAVDKQYLKFNETELLLLKSKNLEGYNYYSDARDYFNCLSNKVKKSFTVNELWYIYIYDQELKKQLTLIK